MDLTNLSVQINNVVTFISGAVTKIQSFQNTLPNMPTELQTITTKSTPDANADKAKIRGKPWVFVVNYRVLSAVCIKYICFNF